MPAMQENYPFNISKFKDVIHLIVDHVGKDIGAECLGNTKLHKCLYYADILHFLDTMRPMTGAEYQRQKFGPTARHLTAALKQLADEGRVRTTNVPYYGYAKKEYSSLRQPEMTRLTNQEVEIVLHVVDFVCKKTATEISDFSHDDVWASVPMGSKIPYFAALAMFPSEFTADDIEDAEGELGSLAPAIEAEKRAGGFF